MTAATHYAFSYLLCSASGFDHGTALVASTFSLLPDIDHPDSLVGRIFGPVSNYIQRRFGHRTVTHSVFAILAIMALLSILSLFYYIQLGKFPSWFSASSLAFASHIFIDLFNRSGVRLFAPFSNKEYISFRTPELRILVNSWQEYVLLFVIVFLAFSVSNRPFSIHSAVRSIAKNFYKTYDSALKDYQENAQKYCIADISYFSEIDRKKIKERLPVISLYPTKAILIKNGSRLCLPRELIDEIVIHPSDKVIASRVLKGSDVKNIPQSGYFSGTITVYNYFPEIRSSDYFEIERHKDRVVFKLYSADVRDISFLTSIDSAIKRYKALLESKLIENQISKLHLEESNLKKRIERLKNNLYDNYGHIQKLSESLKTIQSKIKTLEVQEQLGLDADIKMQLEDLNNVSVFYEIVVVEM